MRWNRERERGLTLLELLITVGLIAVLLLIAFPLVSGTSRQRNAIQCTTHLRTLGVAFRLWLGESNQRLLVRTGGADNRSKGEPDVWGGELIVREYLGPAVGANVYQKVRYADRTPFRCPDGKVSTVETVDNAFWFTYGLNTFDPEGVLERSPNGSDLYRRNCAAISTPAAYPLLADSGRLESGALTQYHRFYSGVASIGFPHQGRGNVLFLDGHIKAVSPDEAANLGFPYYPGVFNKQK